LIAQPAGVVEQMIDGYFRPEIMDLGQIFAA
jgi:hypothetical protein